MVWVYKLIVTLVATAECTMPEKDAPVVLFANPLASDVEGEVESENVENFAANLVECQQMVRDLVKKTSSYSYMVIGLGGSADSEYLRKELHSLRLKTYAVIANCKERLQPHAKSPNPDYANEYINLWGLMVACVEYLETQIMKTLQIQTQFPIHCFPSRVARTKLIPTGVSDVFGKHVNVVRTHQAKHLMDKRKMERETIAMLQRETRQIHDMLTELHESVHMQEWGGVESRPSIVFHHILRIDEEDEDFSVENITTHSGQGDSMDTKKPKCLYVVGFTVLILVITGSIVAVFIALA